LVVAGVSDDNRPARPDGWKSKPENSLMFTPSSIEDTHETIQQKAEAESRADAKRVVYQNTRIQPPEAAGAEPPPSPSISAIQDAIAGRPRRTETESGFTGGETPRVNGYSFVDEDEPEPDEEDEAYHLRLLASQASASDKGPNPFKLQETRKREALHHRMVDRVARNKRAEKLAQGTKTPVPRFPSSPMFGGRTPGLVGSNATTSLTPAAQRLLANVGTPVGARSSGGRSGLKNMWTPTPKRAK
jgi:protein DGCR14